MLYALRDMETNNLVAEYGSLEEALDLVLLGIEGNGTQDTDTLSLEMECENGETTTIAHGQSLADLAQKSKSDGHRLAH